MNFFTLKNVVGLLMIMILFAGVVVGVRLVQQQTQLKSKATVGTCRDNPEAPPSGYNWVADCSGLVCSSNNNCPSGANDQEGWCYGFEDGPKCLQLVSAGSSSGGLSCNPGDGLNTCITSCPAGKTGTCGGHTYCVYSDSGNYESACQCETETQTCSTSTSVLPTVAPTAAPALTCAQGNCDACQPITPCSDKTLETYDRCEDDKNQLYGSTSFCQNGATRFRCRSSQNSACTSNTDLSGSSLESRYAYSCFYCGLGGTTAPTPTRTPVGSAPTPTPLSGVNLPARPTSVCSYTILNSDGNDVRSGPVYEKEQYTVQLTFTNPTTETHTWIDPEYKLQSTNDTATVWAIQQAYALKKQVPPGGSIVFNDVQITAGALPTDKNFEDRAFSFQMADSQGTFGAACEPQIIRVQRKPLGLVSTKCYVISEDPNEVIAVRDSQSPCDHPSARSYPGTTTINFPLTPAPGEKDVNVMFFDNNDRPSNNGTPITKTVIYSPNPSISDVDCSYEPTINASGTAYAIRGAAFGTQTIGSKVRIGNQEASIGSWRADTIVVRVDQRIEGSAPVQVILEDGRKADGACTVGTTTATLSAKSQCQTRQFDAEGVEVKIYSSGPEPFIRQTVKVDKDGNAQGFSPKLEKNKIYTMIVKTPASLAKRVVFSTTSGTSVVGPLVMPVGNIAPSPVVDNVINSFDVSALYSQWSLVKDVSRPGDLNKDSRVNSIDYSCMKLNFNKQDEVFTPPVVVSPIPSASPSATPSPTLPETPTLTPTPTPESDGE